MSSVVIPIQPLSAPAAPSPERRRAQPKGRAVEPAAREAVARACAGLEARRDLLIEHLHRLQDGFGQLEAPQLAALAERLGLAQTEVFEVASFYHHFDVVREGPDGRCPAPPSVTVRVCDGLSCELSGAGELLARLPAILGGDVRVQAVPCVGRCEQAPVAVVHRHPVARATPDAVRAAVEGGRREEPVEGGIGFEAYVAGGGYTLWRDLVEGRRRADAVIAALSEAGLRGLGGAGFPAGRKWSIVRSQPGPRLMAVNADEGEPGTFKDRVLLESDPHRFLEGMLVAAHAVEAEGIWIYLRDEYAGLRMRLKAELERLRAAWPGELPPIELRRGAGAYVCGEESAMLESIEGRRGLPRLRPPYVAERGLFGRPTLVHNVETLFWVRELVERGGAWFASQGRHGRAGLRRFSVSGRVRAPGVKLAPAGITLRELVDEHCGGMAEGHTLYAFLPGGASGGIFPAAMADLPLDFDTLQPHGGFIGSAAVVVLSQQDSAAAAARNLMRFFADESCGQCTPCRAGTAKAVEQLAEPVWDAALLADLSAVMRDASICGLGQAAPNPVDHVLRWFAHEVGGGTAGAAEGVRS